MNLDRQLDELILEYLKGSSNISEISKLFNIKLKEAYDKKLKEEMIERKTIEKKRELLIKAIMEYFTAIKIPVTLEIKNELEDEFKSFEKIFENLDNNKEEVLHDFLKSLLTN